MPAPTTLPMAPNVPITMTIKYIDVWPNDTTKNNGKGYGPSLSLRGTVNGQDCRVYPKGFLDRNLQRLMQANVIEMGAYATDPEAKYSIPVLDGDEIQLVLEQPAGEKYPAFIARNPKLFAAVPKPGREAPKGAPSDDGYLNALLMVPPGSISGGTFPSTTVRTIGTQLTTIQRVSAVDRMRECIGAAIGLANEAKELFHDRPAGFTPEDIQKIAVTLFLDGYGR